MTANAFEEAQKELLRIMAHHMILIAERVHLMDSPRANCHILENACSVWRGKAVFKWETVRPDEPKELQEDLASVACYGPVLNELALRFPGSDLEQSSPSFNVPNSLKSPSDMSFDTACCWPSMVLYDNGLISESSDLFGEPSSGHVVSEKQTLETTFSTPYLEDEGDLWDSRNLGAESMGEAFVPSGLGLHETSTNESDQPWLPDPTDGLSLSMFEVDSDPISGECGVQRVTSPITALNEGRSNDEERNSGAYLMSRTKKAPWSVEETKTLRSIGACVACNSAPHFTIYREVWNGS